MQAGDTLDLNFYYHPDHDQRDLLRRPFMIMPAGRGRIGSAAQNDNDSARRSLIARVKPEVGAFAATFRGASSCRPFLPNLRFLG